jgi:hypothetical protein
MGDSGRQERFMEDRRRLDTDDSFRTKSIVTPYTSSSCAVPSPSGPQNLCGGGRQDNSPLLPVPKFSHLDYAASQGPILHGAYV